MNDKQQKEFDDALDNLKMEIIKALRIDKLADWLSKSHHNRIIFCIGTGLFLVAFILMVIYDKTPQI